MMRTRQRVPPRTSGPHAAPAVEPPGAAAPAEAPAATSSDAGAVPSSSTTPLSTPGALQVPLTSSTLGSNDTQVVATNEASEASETPLSTTELELRAQVLALTSDMNQMKSEMKSEMNRMKSALDSVVTAVSRLSNRAPTMASDEGAALDPTLFRNWSDMPKQAQTFLKVRLAGLFSGAIFTDTRILRSVPYAVPSSNAIMREGLETSLLWQS